LSGSGSTAFAVITAGMAYTAEIKYTATGRYFILINDLESLDISDKKREKRLYNEGSQANVGRVYKEKATTILLASVNIVYFCSIKYPRYYLLIDMPKPRDRI